MAFWTNPFFWAFLSAIGWAMGMLIVGSPSVGRSMTYGIAGSAMMHIPCIILPLPWIVSDQLFLVEKALVPLPLLIVAIAICVTALYFGVSGLGLKIYTRPTCDEPLIIKGRYAIIRHPILFANVLWAFGWPLVFGSIVGLAIAPAWFLLAYLMSFIEEDQLVEAYGEDYESYRKKVPRIIPFVKFL